MNTHIALIMFSGDFDADHPDPELNGSSPKVQLIACGPEQFCWDALVKWTEKHPLRRDEAAEVVTRDPSVVRTPQEV